jgi:signal transduction histidine kinase
MSGATAARVAPLAPRAWLRLPRRTARLRLTLLYTGLFLLSGTCVLIVVYLLVASGSQIDAHTSQAVAVLPVPAKRGLVSPATTPQAATAPTVPDAGVKIVRDNINAQQSNDLNRLLAASWVVLAISAIASAVLGWFAAGRVLRPLREITTTARTISAGNLHERLALTGPNDEFKQLGDTLDDLLGRLQASFEAQRRFVADASHELRTPLTVERTLLQVALADPDANAETLRATCEELLVCGVEQERLLEALLTLATSDRGLDRREPLELSTITEHVLQSDRPEIKRLSLRLQSALHPAPTSGDPALVERLIANLVDNAASHNVQAGRIDVSTESNGDGAVLTVANTGPSIPSDQVDRLFEPFQRLHAGRSADSNGHFGLGLAIVRAIATAHGATLDARSLSDGGLSVSVRFPRP